MRVIYITKSYSENSQTVEYVIRRTSKKPSVISRKKGFVCFVENIGKNCPEDVEKYYANLFWCPFEMKLFSGKSHLFGIKIRTKLMNYLERVFGINGIDILYYMDVFINNEMEKELFKFYDEGFR